MTRHWHPTLERIVRWLKPSAESIAGAAAVHGTELILQLQLEATRGAVEGPPSPECDGLQRRPDASDDGRYRLSSSESNPRPRLAVVWPT